MIIDIETVKKETELANINEERLKRKLKAIEKSIRKYTNNNFMDLKFRYWGEIKGNQIILNSKPLLLAKDNIQLSHCFNNGVYTIETIDDNKITVDAESLLDCGQVMVTKVVYPEDVQERCY